MDGLRRCIRRGLRWIGIQEGEGKYMIMAVCTAALCSYLACSTIDIMLTWREGFNIDGYEIPMIFRVKEVY